jgi:hypothetical protein
MSVDPPAMEPPAINPRALRLAEAAVARLCHDLSGALGAVVNGLDLAVAGESFAAGGADLAAEAIQLSAEAAREVVARLRLARAVWASDTPLKTSDIEALAAGLPNRSRIDLDLGGLAHGTLAPAQGRALLAVLIAAAEALHGPGVIGLSGDPACEVMVMIDGVRAAWPQVLPQLLTDPAAAWDELDSRGLAIRAAVLLAGGSRARLSLLLSSGASSGPAPLLLDLRGV